MANLADRVSGIVNEQVRDIHFGIQFFGEVCQSAVESCRHPARIRWREFFYYLDLCGVRSLTIVLTITFLMGAILGFQSYIQMVKFGTELYIADLVGFSILKELGPLMVAMIATGRAGSAFAAEIGTMIVNSEVDALRTMGISPARFLVIPKLLAMLIAMPLLTIFGDVAGLLGGGFAAVTLAGLPVATYFTRTCQVLSPDTFVMGCLKSFAFAVIISYVGCLRGMQSSSDAQGVGRAATSAVVTSIFAVVIADAVITMMYSFIGY